MKRIGVLQVSQETHGFFGAPTYKSSFYQCSGEQIFRVSADTNCCIAGVMDIFNESGYELVPVISFDAAPSGNIVEAEYRMLKNEVLEAIADAMPLDGLYINFHGAMRSERTADCEGEILKGIRGIVKDIPVVANLDLHANVSEAMFSLADALVVYRRNPHTDKRDRGREAAGIMIGLQEGLRLHKSLIKLPLLLTPLTTWTDGYPLKAGGDVADRIRESGQAVSVSIAGGYCYTDSDIAGVSVLAYTDAEEDAAECERLCRSVAAAIWEKRHTALFTGFTLSDVVKKAVVCGKGPVMIADMGDNIGAGSPGDGTAVLEKLVEYGAERAAVVIWDPQTVALAYQTGEGNTAEFNIGAKTDDRHGRTLKLKCVVERLTSGEYEVGPRSHFGSVHGKIQKMGRCAVLRTGGIYILVTEISTPPGGPEQLDGQGMLAKDMLIIVVKSVVAFRGGYEDIAREIFEADTLGITTCNPSRLPEGKGTDHYFPLDTKAEWN